MGYSDSSLAYTLDLLSKPSKVVELGAQHLHHPDRGPVAEAFRGQGHTYVSIDNGGQDGVLDLDLNTDESPDWLEGDLVTNIGTTEHVFDQRAAFKFIHDSCAVGGRMLHSVPYGMLRHGFYNYTDRTFARLADANGYKMEPLPDFDESKTILSVLLTRTNDRAFMTPTYYT